MSGTPINYNDSNEEQNKKKLQSTISLFDIENIERKIEFAKYMFMMIKFISC